MEDDLLVADCKRYLGKLVYGCVGWENVALVVLVVFGAGDCSVSISRVNLPVMNRSKAVVNLHFVNESVVYQAKSCAGVHDGRVGSTTELLSIYCGRCGVDLPETLATVYVGVVNGGLRGIGSL